MRRYRKRPYSLGYQPAREVGGSVTVDGVAADECAGDFEADAIERGGEPFVVQCREQTALDRRPHVFTENFDGDAEDGVVEQSAHRVLVTQEQSEKIAVLGDGSEDHQVGAADKIFRRRRCAAHFVHGGIERVHPFFEDAAEDGFLAGEIVVEGAAGQSSTTHDVTYRGGIVAWIKKAPPRGAQDGLAVALFILLAFPRLLLDLTRGALSPVVWLDVQDVSM